MSKLSGKIVIVTGAAGAVGKVVTKKFLSEGATVIAVHSGSASSQRFVDETKKDHIHLSDFAVDVTSEQSVDAFFLALEKNFTGVDILINLVGGVAEKRTVEEIPLQEWDRMFALNVRSVLLLSQKVLPMMKRSRSGRIIAISSKSGVTPEAFRGAYGTAKSAVIALIRTIAEEQQGTGDITANVIAPGIILTESNKQWGSADEQRTWVTPEEIAETIVHLCLSPSINGQVIQMYGKGNP